MRIAGSGFFVVALCACGADADPSVPNMTGFTCTPATLPVNVTTRAMCDFEYTDEEGDVVELHLAFTDAGQNLSELDTPFANEEMQMEGPGYLNVDLTAFSAGPATLSVYLIDGDDHHSNTSSFTFTAN